jgi:hypothetical protein
VLIIEVEGVGEQGDGGAEASGSAGGLEMVADDGLGETVDLDPG